LDAQLAIELGLGAGVLAILYGVFLISVVMRQSPGNERMQEIAAAIQEGAMAFLKRQYTTVGIVAVVLFIIIGSRPRRSAGRRPSASRSARCSRARPASSA
jgi:K(+)-stimulated pyrophosphate-energized sodium pump